MIFDAIEAQRQLIAEALTRTKSARRSAQRTAYAVASARPPAALPASASDPMRPGAPPPDGTELPFLPYAIEEWS
jgi:putative transposase